MKPELTGNISSSIRLNVNSPLIDDFTQSVIPIYLERLLNHLVNLYNHNERRSNYDHLGESWVNFQKKHEFNPPHDHSEHI